MAGFCPSQEHVFFADESGISQSQYTVVGGIYIRSKHIPLLHEKISAFRTKHNMHAELKWTKISNQKFEAYAALVDLFFTLNQESIINFHALIFDNYQANHHKYNEGSADIGLSKLYYQLILHKFSNYADESSDMCVCLDRRHSRTSLNDLRDMLNRGITRKRGMPTALIKQLVSQDSKEDDILQLNDVILGAVCAVRNGKHILHDTREAKRVIAHRIVNQSGHRDFTQSSPRHFNHFSVWNFQPRPR